MMRNSLLALLAICLAGCQSAETDTIPVRGLVTIDGQPCADASVIFLPIGQTPGNGGRGTTDQDGRFVTHSHGDLPQQRVLGLPSGEYKVLINKLVTPDGTPFVATEEVSPIDSNAREVIPPKYSDFTLTRLREKVEGASKELIFDLRSK